MAIHSLYDVWPGTTKFVVSTFVLGYFVLYVVFTDTCRLELSSQAAKMDKCAVGSHYRQYYDVHVYTFTNFGVTNETNFYCSNLIGRTVVRTCCNP